MNCLSPIECARNTSCLHREHCFPPRNEITTDLNPKAAQAAADGKLPLHLIDTALTHPTARVLAGGAAKYGVRNWRKVSINASTYIGALRRHTDEWADGSDADKDSGEHPLAHIAATCNVVLDAIKHGTLVDDRAYADAKTASVVKSPVPCVNPDGVCRHTDVCRNHKLCAYA